MEDRIRRLENFAQLATTLAVEMEAAQRRMEAAQLRMEESQRQMEESQRMRDELLEQMLQAVAVIQAEIVRIDETHS
jgi:hypothetical protein